MQEAPRGQPGRPDPLRPAGEHDPQSRARSQPAPCPHLCPAAAPHLGSLPRRAAYKFGANFLPTPPPPAAMFAGTRVALHRGSGFVEVKTEAFGVVVKYLRWVTFIIRKGSVSARSPGFPLPPQTRVRCSCRHQPWGARRPSALRSPGLRGPAEAAAGPGAAGPLRAAAAARGVRLRPAARDVARLPRPAERGEPPGGSGRRAGPRRSSPRARPPGPPMPAPPRRGQRFQGEARPGRAEGPGAVRGGRAATAGPGGAAAGPSRASRGRGALLRRGWVRGCGGPRACAAGSAPGAAAGDSCCLRGALTGLFCERRGRALIILLLFIVTVIIGVLLNPELLDISFPRCDFQPLLRRSRWHLLPQLHSRGYVRRVRSRLLAAPGSSPSPGFHAVVSDSWWFAALLAREQVLASFVSAVTL